MAVAADDEDVDNGQKTTQELGTPFISGTPIEGKCLFGFYSFQFWIISDHFTALASRQYP